MNWTSFRTTKAYDLLCATPNILWLLYGILRQWAVLTGDLHDMVRGTSSASEVFQFFAVFASALLYGTFIYFSVVRMTPAARSRGIVPRLVAIAGGFLTSGLLVLPTVKLSLPVQIVSNVLVFGGAMAAVFVLNRLGRSFSIMPEARKLVTAGPYKYVRHPLYVVEMISVLGTAMQFIQPWALLLWAAAVVLEYIRTHYEEQVLEGQFPEYADYRLRTHRFIPGVF
ncbi:MAG: isoprenylcysteine carboxylmethyltransferase family protein [Alphaproteobacteria bacterium]|nr:isoprenylcysteine carboxylmethyltransferase family protein [Alphaproteobacteria bacterium]